MRRYLPFVVLAALLPAAAAAQQRPARPDSSSQAPLGPQPTVPQARAAALARVREEVRLNRIMVWRPGVGPTRNASWRPRGELVARPGDVAVWEDLLVVAVSAPNTDGHVRVVIDRRSGAILRVIYGPWRWIYAPSWWVRGAAAPPGHGG